MESFENYMKFCPKTFLAIFVALSICLPFDSDDANSEETEVATISSSSEFVAGKRSLPSLPQHWTRGITDIISGDSAQLLFGLPMDDDPNWIPTFHPLGLYESNEFKHPKLFETILKAGGEVAILGQPGLSLLPNKNLEEEGVFVIPNLPRLALWVRNYLGFISKADNNQNNSIFLRHKLGDSNLRAEQEIGQIFATRVQATTTSIPLTLQGGGIIALGEGVAAVSPRIVIENPEVTRKYIHDVVLSLGFKRVVWTPFLSGDLTGHADISVGYINRCVVVPQIATEAIRFLDNKSYAICAQSQLDDFAHRVEQQFQLPVVRLLMPAPLGPNEFGVTAYYSPVNWVVVRDRKSDRRTVIVPFPYSGRPDESLYELYKAQHAETAAQLGIEIQHVDTMAPEFGGGFKCLNALIPRDVVRALSV